jgi:hypothetical protein
MSFQVGFAVLIYILSIHKAVSSESPVFPILHLIYYISSLVVSTALSAYFVWTHYIPSHKYTTIEESLKWALSSGLAFLLFASIIHIFFLIATGIGGAGLYDVRVSVLSCSLRYSLWLLFLYRVRLNSTPVFIVDPARVVRRRGSSTLVMSGSSAGIKSSVTASRTPELLYDLYSSENYSSTF